MSEIVKVGMADLKTCVSPNGATTLGLGSCVGIAIRDPITKIGGLAHIMLPDSKAIRNSQMNVAKFADTGIEELVKQMERLGFTNRGVKADEDLYFLNHTKGPAILIETCFVDAKVR